MNDDNEKPARVSFSGIELGSTSGDLWMSPGQLLDAVVAERVMGLEVRRYEDLKGSGIGENIGTLWVPVKDQNFGTPYAQWDRLPAYSTEIAAAWGIVEHLMRRDLVVLTESVGERGTTVRIERTSSVAVAEAVGETAPHAICLAALKAVSR